MGGGFDPISALVSLVFGAAAGALSSDSGHSSSDNSLAQAEAAAEEARRRDLRSRREAELLAQSRKSERARQAEEDTQAESLGAPRTETLGLKARLGQ